MKNTKVGYIYRDADKRRRIHGIYAPGLDRFILVDYSDVWCTLETAEILSSKLPTVAYVLHTINFDFGNHNCLDYTISNKTNQKIGSISIVNRRQRPTLRFIPYATNPIQWVGPNPDYTTPEKIQMLDRLQRYGEFVLDTVYAMRVTDAMLNWYNDQDFLDKHIKDDSLMTDDGMLTSSHDMSPLSKGIFFEIRHALYISQTIEEAEQRINEAWEVGMSEQEYLMKSFYNNWNKPLPATLETNTVFKPVKLSPALL